MDLANGGGKSLLMLMLLQNVIPNCTLDEKQPVESFSGRGEEIQSYILLWNGTGAMLQKR